jgi:hypothetical protein
MPGLLAGCIIPHHHEKRKPRSCAERARVPAGIRIRAFFDRITGGDRDRRKIALIATTHHLTRVMLTMLKTGKAWEERLAAETSERLHPQGSEPMEET